MNNPSRRLLGALRALSLAVLGAVIPGEGAARPRALGEQRQLDVRVVEVAGNRAYLTPGSAEHVRAGDQARIGNRRYVVLAVNAQSMVIGLRKAKLARGDRGVITVRVESARTFAEQPRPRPLSAFAGRWAQVAQPAATQRPRPVPLGAMRDPRRNRAVFALDYQRIQPLAGAADGIGRTRLRAVLHAELDDIPLSLDADGFAEFWQSADLASRPGNASRPFITVRQLELGYAGELAQAAAGRLRYASRTLGPLDGGRVSARLTPSLSLAAFGGTLADPLTGGFETDAARFGAELAWRGDDAEWRPQASLTLSGSRFLGQVDERRITGLFESFPAFGRLGARAEVSFFEPDNPWAAAPTEVTAAGADASVRFDSLRLGLSLDMRRPERSLWLASFLPRGYFCVARTVPGNVGTEPCDGSAERYAAVLSAGWDVGPWTLAGGATLTATRGAEAEQSMGFIHARHGALIGPLRLDAGASVSRGSLVDSVALDLSTGAPLLADMADVSIYYRPSQLRYRADPDSLVEHGFGTRFWWAASETLDLSGSVDALTGGDADVLMFLVSAAYHPRF